MLYCGLCPGSLKHSATGTRTRTRVARVRAEFPNKLEYSGLRGGIFFYHRTEMSNICTFTIKVNIAHMCELLFFHTFKIMRIRSPGPWELISKSQRCQHHSLKMSKVLTAVGLEPMMAAASAPGIATQFLSPNRAILSRGILFPSPNATHPHTCTAFMG